MFFLLLLVTFVIALCTSILVMRFFSTPMAAIIGRLVPETLGLAWLRYLQFAITVVGVAGGVRIWDLERYITPEPVPHGNGFRILELTPERWVLEVYRTLIGTLQSISTTLLFFFIFSLVAYVVVRIFESRHPPGSPKDP